MNHASGRSKRNNSVTAGRRTLYYLMTALILPYPVGSPPMLFTLILIYFPALVFGFLFIKNYRKEPRQFRNALYFLLLCLFALYGLSIQFELPWLVLIGFAAIPFGTVALVVIESAHSVAPCVVGNDKSHLITCGKNSCGILSATVGYVRVIH